MATKETDLFVNPKTGLVAVKFLGVPSEDKRERLGDAGAGLMVGEVRGLIPENAVKWIDAGIGEAVDIKLVKAAIAAEDKAAATVTGA